MKETALKFSVHDLMHITAIVIDDDREAALSFIKELLGRKETAESGRLKNHLDN